MADVSVSRRSLATISAVMVILIGAILLFTQGLNVIAMSPTCPANAVACNGVGGTQTWWGLSMNGSTWEGLSTALPVGGPLSNLNFWAFLFPAVALSAVAWGAIALTARRLRHTLVTLAASIVILTVAALTANLTRLAQFTSFWVHWACLNGGCPAATQREVGVPTTVGLSVLLVAVLILASCFVWFGGDVENRSGITSSTEEEPSPHMSDAGSA